MQQYSDTVKADINKNLTSVAEEALTKVKDASPKRTGKYRRGWKMTKTQDSDLMTFTVHQSKGRAQLTHLLENGHRKRNKQGWVQAQPHIKAVEEWAEKEAVKAVEKAVRG